MSNFPIATAPDTQKMTPDVPVHTATTSDGVQHSRKKHSSEIQKWSATYTFSSRVDAELILAHYKTDRVTVFDYYDWRDGTSTTISNCKWVSVDDTTNQVGEYVVNIVLRRLV